MHLKERIAALDWLGQQLVDFSEPLQAAIRYTHLKNEWFTPENTEKALRSIQSTFLQKSALEKWMAHYTFPSEQIPLKVALVLAGNIPLVGFHDVLCVFLSGHRAQVKLSEKDKYLLPYLIKVMAEQYPAVKNRIQFTEKLEDYDAVIATGSNNSARYFESYFGRYPHIIRKNRNAVAVLDGKETAEDLAGLGEDIFTYFGLGCRNVSKIYVPPAYDFEPLLTALHEHRQIVLHSKYKNNFDYNYTLLILNRVPYQANGCILLTENDALTSRIANLHYAYYDSEAALQEELENRREEIQCVVSRKEIENWQVVAPGQAQHPGLLDYADGVDTMQFLLAL